MNQRNSKKNKLGSRVVGLGLNYQGFNHMVLASLLIIIGIAFLLKNLGYISGSTWGIIWPVFLIVFGIGILLRKDKGGFFWKECCGWRKKEIEDKQK